MVRNVSSVILYTLLAAGITLMTVNAMLPPAFWLVALIASLILIAPPLSLALRFALYAIAAFNIFAVMLLLLFIPIAGVAAVAMVGSLCVSEWLTVRNKRIAQTNTEQKDRLFHAPAQATSHLVNASEFSTGINLALSIWARRAAWTASTSFKIIRHLILQK